MYKLLTTAAVIMTVATPTIANDWTGAKDVITNLETIYNSLDGEAHFGRLQGDFTTGNGELADFLSEVDKGVTHVTLTVDPTTYNISTKIEAGSTLAEIQTKQTNLVNRVNYDLFVETADTTFDSTGATDYTTFNPGEYNVGTPGSVGDIDDNQYVSSHNDGLAGAKITGLVDNVNLANDYLVDVNRTKDQSNAFVTAWDNKTGGLDGDGNEITFGGSNIAVINSDIADLNTAIDAARDDNAVNGTNSFFGNINLGGIAADGSNINSFLIPSFTDPGNIGNAGEGNFTSISDWANDVQTIDVEGKLYNYAGTDSLEVVDADNVLVGGVSTPITDAAFTLVPLP